MPKQIYFFAILFIAISCILAGCFVPEKYDISINVNNNGRFDFRFDGTVAYVLALEKMALEGLTREDEQDLKNDLEKEFKKEDFTQVKYKGKGRTQVHYEYSGQLDSSWTFMDTIRISQDEFGVINIETNGFNGRTEKEINKLGLKLNGHVTITTNGEVIGHNGNNPKGFFGKGRYKWRITSIKDPMPEMTVMTEATRVRTKEHEAIKKMLFQLRQTVIEKNTGAFKQLFLVMHPKVLNGKKYYSEYVEEIFAHSCFLQSKNPHFCKQKSSVEGGEFLTIKIV